MHAVKILLLPLLLIGSLIGFDNLHAAGDLTRLTTHLPELRLGSEDSDYRMPHHEYALETGKAASVPAVLHAADDGTRSGSWKN